MSYIPYVDPRYTITMLDPNTVRISFTASTTYGVPVYSPGLFPGNPQYAHNTVAWQMAKELTPGGGFTVSVPAVSVSPVDSLTFDIATQPTIPLYEGQTLQLIANIKFEPTITYPAGYLQPVSGTVYRTVEATVPGAPIIGDIVPAIDYLTISYLAPVSDGGATITAYEYSLDGGATYAPCVFPPGPFNTSTLTPATTYSVTLRAQNSVGHGEWATPVEVSTLAIPTDIPEYRVYAVSDRVVRIQFIETPTTTKPVHVSSTGTKDALNPRSWNVVQPFGITYTVMSVLGSADGYTYDILTLEHFPRYNAGDLLFTGQVRMENGDEPSISTTFSGSIQSADTSPNAKATTRGLQVRDLNNVVTPYEDLVGGTLVINSGGDYESMSGEAFIRKLVMRRLISQKGDFFHLPNYGGGLRVKATFSTANLRAMAKDIEMQVLQEPEIEAARASLTYQAASSTLVIQVKARMRSTGQETALSMNLPVGSIQF